MEGHSSKSTELKNPEIISTSVEVPNEDSAAVLTGDEVASSDTTVSVSRSRFSKKLLPYSAVQLPPELIAIILSKLPFPEIFQAKMLSRSWYTKLPSLRPVKSMTSFSQENLSSSILPQYDVSSYWSAYCPVFVSGQEMVGYERVYKRWRKLPIHCGIPVLEQLLKVPYFGFMVNVIGPFMFVYRLGLEESKVLVANPLLGHWRNLSGFPTVHESSCICKVGAEDYKVVIHDPWQQCDGYVRFKTRVLDLKTTVWTRCESVHRSHVNDGVVDYGKNVLFCAHKDGILYCTLTSWWSKKLELWKYTIEGGMWTNIPLDTRFEEFEFQTCGLFAVASQILLVTLVDRTYTNRHSSYYSESARVYRLDMKSLQLSEPWKSPPMLTRFCSFNNNHSRVICDSECLYFIREIRRPGQGSFPIEMWSYHVSTETWSSVPSPPGEYFKICTFLNLAEGSFAPGLNPCASP